MTHGDRAEALKKLAAVLRNIRSLVQALTSEINCALEILCELVEADAPQERGD